MSAVDLTRRSLLGAGAALVAGPVLAKTRDPRVAGFTGLREDGVLAFKGIRYGRAARFERAVAEPWNGAPIKAQAFAAIAPQRGNPDLPQSEDCLFLNVWTPDANPKARRAVMVYFHGGAYANGTVTDPLTHGGKLAAQGDVVVVTVNHRLNAFGYAWLKPFGPRYADSGNLGQLDLILALEWVHAHIAEFGGDPARVMVFGQSGGGAKIATLIAMPAAKGLFHSAATMSGQQVTASGPANAWKRTQALLAALKLAPSDVEMLRTMPVQHLVDGLAATDPVIGGSLYFGPVLDMTNLPRHPFWPDAAPQSRQIPMILGNTREETRAFIDPRGPKLQGLDWDNLAARIAPEIKIDLDVHWVVAQYRAHYPDWTPQQAFYSATTAGRSWPGQVIEADERAKAGATATWVYQFDRPSPLDPLRGAAHTDDIPYVFGTLDAPGSMSGTDAGAQATSRLLMQAFTGLAKTGLPGLAAWTPYTLPDRATLVVGDGQVETVHDPRQWERELWARAPYVQPGS
ncbi:MAG: carboxylesterase [Novosphingobium sp. 28-62-57]|uniref:carboxylesterase/lipase family protein n=1 Tax=unclassified Novosphingobium TaxID=2644732 RepID=UPI000BDB8DA1|nr:MULTISPECIES: carboxylesterase family protein [unclassified Novosphingobium]OYW51379.1 MAG: carboxylesterase [Novosphingobium sp. 12-62-10]OYZ10485.1 MAG: carboxylesterase [Novosphingobium sp. 28-62-57]OZA40634.1 MAG: carboxylesterase [Novosphingobium sp. 17-62-9]HQS68118.1 carboxylesterase family protein [Novosphingobium sp.]